MENNDIKKLNMKENRYEESKQVLENAESNEVVKSVVNSQDSEDRTSIGESSVSCFIVTKLKLPFNKETLILTRVTMKLLTSVVMKLKI